VIAIPQRLLVAGGIAAACAALLFLADRNGYSRAVAKYSAEAAQAAEDAKQDQAAQQAKIIAVNDALQKALERNRATAQRLERTKEKLREQDHAHTSDRTIHGTVLPAVYRMFNAAADHPDLPAADGSRIPDAAGDGLDAIQACFQERHRYGLQLNALQQIIRTSDCFIQP